MSEFDAFHFLRQISQLVASWYIQSKFILLSLAHSTHPILSVMLKRKEYQKIFYTYIEPPGSFVDCWLSINAALKVNVITFFDFVCIQSWAQ